MALTHYETAVERLADELAARGLALSEQWQAIVSAESFDAAVNVAANAYHEDECLYKIERDALAATLARVKVEGDRWANSTNYTYQFAGGLLREALRPPEGFDE